MVTTWLKRLLSWGKTQTGKALQNYNASRDNMYDLVPVVYFERARGHVPGKDARAVAWSPI